MFPAAKNMDPVVGVDIHIIQPPGPVPPVPIPHPFIGMLIDPFDFIPVVGATVMVNNVPRAIAGTAGKGLPPHIPIGGMFVKPPTNECELFMGSATVAIDGDAAGYMALMCLSCHDIGMPPPPRINPKKKSKTKSLVLPTSVVLPIPMGLPVLIGGPPTIFTMALAQKLGMAALGRAFRRLRALQRGSRRWRALSVRLRRAANRLMRRMGIPPASRFANRVRRGICTLTGHPVDVATGKVLTEMVDLELPGPLPFRLERVWYSTSSHDGPFGTGWHHTYDLGLAIDARAGVAVVRLADGRYAPFALPTDETPARNELEKAWLRLDAEGYVFEDEAGLRHHFGRTPATERETWLPLLRQEDAFGNAITFHYGPQGHLRGIVDSAGRKLPVSTDAHGRITEIQGPHPTVPNREVTLLSYRYSYEGELVEARDALGHPFRYAYDDEHRLVEETDRLGLTFYFEYEGSGIESRCIQTWGDGGVFERHLTYDLDARTTTVVDSRGGVTVHEWNALGLVTRTVDGLGGEWLYEYDDRANLLSETDPLGAKTARTYDDTDRLVSVTDPLGAVDRFTYDAQGRLTTVTDPEGHTWTQTYRADGALESVEAPDGAVDRYEVDARGMLLSRTAAGGRTTRLIRDAAGNVVEIHDPTHATTVLAYDTLGRLTQRTDPEGHLESLERDALGRIVCYRTAEGRSGRLKYDAAGNVVATVDSSGRSRSYLYAPLGPGGRLVQIGEASGTTTAYHYDSEGDLVGVTDALGRRWVYERNLLGQTVRESDATGRVLQYDLDATGRATTLRDARGHITTLSRDSRGRLRSRTFSDGVTEQFDYTLRGQLRQAQNPECTLRFEYDSVGRLVRQFQDDEIIESTYDAAGDRVVRTIEGFESVAFEYDAASRLIGVFSPSSRLLAIERDRLGREVERHLAAGARSQRRYTASGDLMAQRVLPSDSDSPLLDRRYTYDKLGRLSAITDNRSGARSYTHDVDGFLASTRYPEGRIEKYTRDTVGNPPATPLQVELDPDRESRGARPEAAVRQSDGWTLTYDADGNLVSKEGHGATYQFSYDGAGRLASATLDGETVAEFGYDALGRRVRKTTPERVVRYLWDVQVLACERIELREADAVPAHARQYLFDGVAPLAVLGGSDDSGLDAFIECDHIGTPRMAVDSTGTLIWEADLGGFGDIRSEHIRDGSLGIDLRFPGQIYDPETGLSYNRFRYYDASTRTYTQSDPAGLFGGLMTHAYVQNPLEWIDFLGLAGIFTRTTWQSTTNGTGNNYTVYQQDIDWDQEFITGKDASGNLTTETNLDRAARGSAPRIRDSNNRLVPVNLHHSQQRGGGPLFEISQTTHNRYYGSTALHPHLGVGQNPFDPVDRARFDIDRGNYWRARARAEQARRLRLQPCS